jgi:hypothetical protein
VKLWLGGLVGAFGLFLLVQTLTLTLRFTDSALEVYRRETVIRTFPYAEWQHWDIFWKPVPVLFYFREINSIHFLPIILAPANCASASNPLRGGPRRVTGHQGRTKPPSDRLTTGSMGTVMTAEELSQSRLGPEGTSGYGSPEASSALVLIQRVSSQTGAIALTLYASRRLTSSAALLICK